MSGTEDPAEASPRVHMLVPLASGLAVLMLGYVALRLFWKFGAYPADIRGLFYYHAAT